MAFVQTQYYSAVLNVAVTVNVILPEANQGIGIQTVEKQELPKVLYLLHGYSDDHSIWARRTSIERYAARHNLAVIMPAVNHSWYMNEPYGERYWDFISEELPRVMHTFFRLSDKPEDTFVAGNSMGGYGTMRLALTYPERFGAACCLSGAVNLIARIAGKGGNPSLQNIVSSMTQEELDQLDLFKLLTKPSAKRPKLYVACGTKDFLYDHHLEFVPLLEKNGWQVERVDTPDAVHNWDYWDGQIEYFVDHYCM